jgi:hypothetical protein
MALESIRLGAKGPAVEAWQYFLLGLGLFKGEVDGTFTLETEGATHRFQEQYNKKLVREGSKARPLLVDGWAGTDTYGAAFSMGFDPLHYSLEESLQKGSPAWPAFPVGLRPLSAVEKQEKFGVIKFVPAATPANPEAIRIVNSWDGNIELVSLPQLKGVAGAEGSNRFPFHRLVAKQVQGLFQVWEEMKLLPHILSYGGSWAPRFVRGSRTVLSSHAWGTAFDINVTWNGYGRRPALVGEKGSVRELVETAVGLGFYWGGWFPRKDGMHFECYDVL